MSFTAKNSLRRMTLYHPDGILYAKEWARRNLPPEEYVNALKTIAATYQLKIAMDNLF